VTDAIMIFLRPKMSASRPRKIEPNPVPTAPKLITGPQIARREMPGRPECRRGIGERLGVEAVEELHEQAERDDPYMETDRSAARRLPRRRRLILPLSSNTRTAQIPL